MTSEVVITGFGVFTAFGLGADALRSGVFAGTPGFRPVTRFNTAPFRAKYAATYPEDSLGGRALGQYAVLHACVRDALDMAGLSTPLAAPVLLGTGGDRDESDQFWSSPERHDSSDVLASLPAQVPRQIATEFDLGRPRMAFVNACIASTNAIIHGCRLIHSGKADVVVSGGGALVGPQVFGWFDSGRALSSGAQIHPFSKHRAGLLLGDGAAILVLENADRARDRGKEPLAKIIGWGMSADAYHVIQPHPEGTGLTAAATAALRMAETSPDQIDYVNAHGTATALNDIAETKALRRIFGGHANTVAISSTKSTTGHTLEAAGAVETVITLLALRDGVLPPTVGDDEPDPECDLDYVPNHPRHIQARRALTLNAAFGGLNAVVVLERT